MEVDVVQELMNEAYDKWQDEWSRSDFLGYIKENLSEEHYIAVIFGNLNYQVENGGFSQWDFNDYSEDLDDLLYYVKEIPGEAAEKVSECLEKFKEFFEEREKLIDAIDRVPWELFEYKDELVEPIELNFMDKLSKLDDEYYDINEKFLEDLDRYLEGRLEHGNNSGSGENG